VFTLDGLVNQTDDIGNLAKALRVQPPFKSHGFPRSISARMPLVAGSAPSFQWKLTCLWRLSCDSGHTDAATGGSDGLNCTQPEVSALVNYKLSGFSLARLMEFLTDLDRDVEIGIRKTTGHGHIRV
jgi:hypothetical protein